jgi:hypothetical protein
MDKVLLFSVDETVDLFAQVVDLLEIGLPLRLQLHLHLLQLDRVLRTHVAEIGVSVGQFNDFLLQALDITTVLGLQILLLLIQLPS